MASSEQIKQPGVGASVVGASEVGSSDVMSAKVVSVMELNNLLEEAHTVGRTCQLQP